jgi:hypothetical protein
MTHRVVVATIFLVVGSLLVHADAPDFAILLAANPKLNRWLTVQMVSGGGPKKSYTATAFETSQILWQKDNQAIYFVTARPPTEATQEEIGVLIAARSGASGRWNVMKSIRLEATGKYAGTAVEVTSSAAVPSYDVPVITVTLNQGGRGYAYAESFTYSMIDDSFVLHQPGKQIPFGG